VPGKNCSCIAFRLDDIQDFYINAAQMGVISLFKQYNIPLSIGVIGNYLKSDIELISFLKSNLNVPGWPLEVTDHGWNHEDFTLVRKPAIERDFKEIKCIGPLAITKGPIHLIP
jgi:hypothetical protein